ncbi:hypothetical protein [Herbidospora sp. NBRC 101105]|nr:hypothetical protein [Herbidospora sp. NBRC 101105]
MRRRALRMGIVALGLTAVTLTATPAHAGVVGYYPSSVSCEAAGQRGLGAVWPWYSCYPSGSVWALWAPGF